MMCLRSANSLYSCGIGVISLIYFLYMRLSVYTLTALDLASGVHAQNLKLAQCIFGGTLEEHLIYDKLGNLGYLIP